jgi:hypothetical protein
LPKLSVFASQSVLAPFFARKEKRGEKDKEKPIEF